jgi:hypothetical protein
MGLEEVGRFGDSGYLGRGSRWGHWAIWSFQGQLLHVKGFPEVRAPSYGEGAEKVMWIIGLKRALTIFHFKFIIRQVSWVDKKRNGLRWNENARLTMDEVNFKTR